MKGLIVAFSMYSKIPMPKILWSKDSMKYAICYFPLIGVVISAVLYATFFVSEYLEFNVVLRTSLMVALPLMITGGIHMDGYLDTVDALSSYADREKKIEILKDPHMGAFAVIRGMLYVVLIFGFWSEVTIEILPFLCVGYVCSRAYSGLAVVSFQKANGNGTLATFSNHAQKRVVQVMMLGYLLVSTILFLYLNTIVGIVCTMTGIATFFYYKYRAYKEFGGITGDLAGYFVQLYELMILIATILAVAIVR